MAKRPSLDSVDASLARWKTRLKRAVTMIDKLEKQKKRLLNPRAPRPRGHVDLENFVETFGPAIRESAEDAGLCKKPDPKPEPKSEPADLDIPEFLRRQEQTVADAIAADAIKEEQAEIKRKKARGRIDRLKAKKAGKLKAMPLSGKAALEHIRNG